MYGSQIEYIRPNLSHKPPEYHTEKILLHKIGIFFWFSIEYLNINKSVTRCKALIQYTYIKIYEIKY